MLVHNKNGFTHWQLKHWLHNGDFLRQNGDILFSMLDK